MAHLPLVNSNPICCGKPLVSFYITHTILQVSKPFRQIHLQQVPEKVLEIWTEVRWESDLYEHTMWSNSYSSGYHGLTVKQTTYLWRKCFKGLRDPFMNSSHSYHGSLQVPPSSYDLCRVSWHYLSWSLLRYVVIFVYVFFLQIMSFWGEGTVPFCVFIPRIYCHFK